MLKTRCVKYEVIHKVIMKLLNNFIIRCVCVCLKDYLLTLHKIEGIINDKTH